MEDGVIRQATVRGSKSQPRVIGLDLGTSNTCAGFADGRIPRIIPTERGHTLLPSVVGFAGDACLVGHAARERLLIHPAETVYGTKRLIGRPYHAPQVQRLLPHFSYKIVEGRQGLAAVRIEDRIIEMSEVSAILLRQMARYAAEHLQGPIDGAVITVPAYYPQSQREAVRRAAQEAGLDVWRLVNEPTAAALAYGIGRSLDQKVLVFDLGGGTFDVSILEIQNGTFHVLATGGDGFLGGVDFDLRLLEYLLSRFEEEEGVSLREDPVVVQRVLMAAEVAKCDLSLLQHAEVRLPFVTTRRGQPVDLLLHVNRQILNKHTEDLIDRCIQYVDNVVAEAGLRHSEIDEVLLAGGQTRMPALQARLERHFGKAPRKGLHPDEVVAQGAALLARSFGTTEGIRLLDVLSVPIGIARRNPNRVVPDFEIVLDRNRVLPHHATVTCDTTEDHQTEMQVEFFQGYRADLRETEYVGTVHVSGLPRAPAGRVTVFLDVTMTTEGRLEVRAHGGDPAQAVLLPLRVEPPAFWTATESPRSNVQTRPDEAAKPAGLFARLFGR